MENTEMKKIIDRQRTFFQTGTTLDVSFRIAALKRLQYMIHRHEKEIEAAGGKWSGKKNAYYFRVA